MRPEPNESKPVNTPADPAGKHDTPLDAGGGVVGAGGAGDPLSAINQFEAQLGAIKRLHAEVSQRQLEIAQHSREIAAQRAEMDATRATVLRERDEIATLRDSFLKEAEDTEAERRALHEARARIDADAAQARAELEAASRLEDECSRKSAEVRAAGEETSRRAEAVARQEEACTAREAELVKQTERVAKLRSELEGSLKQFQADRKGLEQHLAQLNKDREQIAAELKAGEEARWEIQAQAESLRSQLEAAGELEAQCARQAAELRLREADHAKRSVELGTMEKVLEKTREKLTATMSKRAAELDARESRVIELEARAGGTGDALAAELEAARTKLAELAAALEEARGRLEASESRGAARTGEEERELAEVRASLAEATARCVSREAEAAHLRQSQTELETRLAETEQLLAEARGAASAGAAPAQDLSKYEQAIKILSERLKAAQAQNAVLARQVEDAQASGPGAGALGADGGEADDRNRLRRERLGRYKSLLNAQARKIVQVQNALTKRHTAAEQILSQRAKLAVVARELHRREAQLSSAKARSSTAALMFYAVATLGVLMALSWGIAVKYAPATFAAHAVIQADYKGKQPSEGNAVAWQQYMESLAEDPQLVEAAAERLEQRGIAELSNPGALRQELRRSLLIESATPDSISVSMKGSRPESTMVVLDTLVTAMVSTANAGRAQRPDGIAAEVAKAAQVGDGPVSDQRLTYAGGIFGGSSLLSMACAVLIGKRLGKLKRQESDEAAEAALDERNWAVNAMPEVDEQEQL